MVTGGVSDPRAMRARDLHRRSRAEQTSLDRLRIERNELIRTLRAENPTRWTYPALAKAVDCPKEMIAAICQGRVR